MMTNYDRLYSLLKPVANVSSLIVDGNTAVVELSESTTEQEALVRDIIDNFDWSDTALRTWQIAYDRQKAIEALFGDSGHVQVGVRATFRVLWTELNNVREHLGMTRLNEQQIAGMIIQAIQSGEGDPVSLGD